jgi:hypothetical protein
MRDIPTVYLAVINSVDSKTYVCFDSMSISGIFSDYPFQEVAKYLRACTMSG